MLRPIRPALPLALALSLLGASSAAAENAMTITFDVSRNVNVEGAQAQSHGWLAATVKGYKPLEFAVVKLKPGKDSGVFANTAYRLSPAQLARWGTLVMSGVTRPGAPHVVTANVEAGWHSIVIRGDRGYVPGGFTAGAPLNEAPKPAAATTVTLRDGALAAPANLTAGATVEVVNGGGQVRDLRIARLAKGQTVAAADKLLRRGRARQVRWSGAPRTLVGWISPRVSNVVAPRLAKGRWVLISDGADGRAAARAVTVK